MVYISFTVKPYDNCVCRWQISDIAEGEIKKLEKKYKEGNHVRVRILGLRHLEGLATGVLKVVILLTFYLIF